MSSFVIKPKTLDDFQQVILIASKYEVDAIAESVNGTIDGIRLVIYKFEWAPQNFKKCFEEVSKQFNIQPPDTEYVKVKEECFYKLKYPLSLTSFVLKMAIFIGLFYYINF